MCLFVFMMWVVVGVLWCSFIVCVVLVMMVWVIIWCLCGWLCRLCDMVCRWW